MTTGPYPSATPTSSSRSTSAAAPPPRSNGPSSGSEPAATRGGAPHRRGAAASRSCRERLPEVEGVELAAGVPARRGRRRRRRRLVRRVRPSTDARIVLVVGDVAGHGIEAASLMGRVRNALRAYAVEDSDPAAILLRAARVCCALGRRRDGDRLRRVLRPRNAGAQRGRARSSPAARVRPDGTTRFLDDVNATPLGTMAQELRDRDTRPRGRRARRALHRRPHRTARPPHRRRTGVARRTREVDVHDAPAADICATSSSTIRSSPHPSADDICVLVLRVRSQER